MKKLLFFGMLLMANVTVAKPVVDVEKIETAKTDTATVEKESFLKSWWNSLINGNVDRTFEKPMDVSFAVSPYYSQESSVGIGGQLSGLFRFDRTDSLVHVSDISISGGASINGTYSIGLQGNAHFNRNQRLNYNVSFQHQERDFWGITYDDCSRNVKCKNKINRIQFSGDYQHRIGRSNWFWGAALRLKSIKANPDSISYLKGDNPEGFFTGVGILVQYDSRDFALNPSRGIYFLARDVFYPNFLGQNERNVFCTTWQFNAYHPLWKGATLAYDLFGEFNTSNGYVPWQLREEINVDDRRMRGYYSGCYIDNNLICGQVELRQNVYKRFGAVAWVGGGTLFNNAEDIRADHLLPTYGVGVRFELKHRTNIRMDFGMGRDNSGISFSFAEAF